MATLTAKEQKLLDERVTAFKSYKKHTQRQANILALAEKSVRTDDETKRLKALLDIEQKALDLANSQKALDKLARAEKDKERQKFDNATYQLGGLFRAMLKQNNPTFIQVFRQAVQNKTIKTTYTDGSPLYADYDKFLATTVTSTGFNHQVGTNTPPHYQNR